MKRVLFFAACFCLLLIPSKAYACSCATGGPPSEFNRAKAVFVGRMLGGTEKISLKDQKGKPYSIEAGAVRFSVEEVFKGDVAFETTLDIASHKGTSCGPYGLRRGVRYVVYAYAEEPNAKNLYTGVCTRTKPLDVSYAKDDLDFLRTLPPPGTGGNLRGRIWADLRGDGATPLAGVKVNIRGADNQLVTAVTDQEGEFELKLLKPGKYEVAPVLPEHYMTDEPTDEVEIEDRGTANVGFEFYSDGVVSGRVLDKDGRDFNSISLHLEGEGKSVYGYATGEDGGFEAEGTPPGEYLLYVQLHHSDYKKNRKYYYPGTFDPAAATPVRLGVGEKVKGLEFTLPDEFRVRTIEGQVVWPDGSPATGVEINLLCPQSTRPDGLAVESSPTSVKTDEQGHFTLEGFAGESYWIEARGSKKEGKGREATAAHSPSNNIFLKDDLKNVKLVMSEKGFFGAGCR